MLCVDPPAPQIAGHLALRWDRELGEHAVAGGTDESSVVEFDQSVDDFAVRGESAESRLFVVPHEAAVAVHICAENGGELTFQPL